MSAGRACRYTVHAFWKIPRISFSGACPAPQKALSVLRCFDRVPVLLRSLSVDCVRSPLEGRVGNAVTFTPQPLSLSRVIRHPYSWYGHLPPMNGPSSQRTTLWHTRVILISPADGAVSSTSISVYLRVIGQHDTTSHGHNNLIVRLNASKLRSGQNSATMF